MVRSLDLEHITFYNILLPRMIDIPGDLFISVVGKRLVGVLLIPITSYREIVYLVIGGNIKRIGFQYDRLRGIHGALNFHRDVKTAHYIVAIQIHHVRVLITSNRISRTVYPIPVGFLNGKIQDPDLTETGSSVFVYYIEEGILQLRRRIGVAALHFRQYAGLFSSGLVFRFFTLTTVMHRIAHKIRLVSVCSRFDIVELQIGQPVRCTHALEIKFMPLSVRSNMYRHTVVGIGHDDSIGQHLQSHPTSVVGVAAIAVISYRSVMPFVVRFVYQEDRLIGRSLQLRPTCSHPNTPRNFESIQWRK